RKDALSRLSGSLSSAIAEAREACLDLLANVESRLDYPDEEGPDDVADTSKVAGEGQAFSGAFGNASGGAFGNASGGAYSPSAQIGHLKARLAELSAGFSASRLRQEGAVVVLAGRPNAGKSSLFNSLVREERAIVSPEPGTTRDWIESWIELGGWALRLIDTAGLREAGEGVEAEGVRRSLGRAEEADILVYVVDGAEGLAEEDSRYLDSHPGALRAWNKADRADCFPAPPGWILTSAHRQGGIAALESGLLKELGSMADLPGPGAGGIANHRQKALVDRAISILDAAEAQEASGASLDILALSLREAAQTLGEITGEYPSEAVLERIFGSFCLGK
ncbi:MAG TPA: GTPase, partial [Rectinemataceae bacterium]